MVSIITTAEGGLEGRRDEKGRKAKELKNDLTRALTFRQRGRGAKRRGWGAKRRGRLGEDRANKGSPEQEGRNSQADRQVALLHSTTLKTRSPGGEEREVHTDQTGRIVTVQVARDLWSTGHS